MGNNTLCPDCGATICEKCLDPICPFCGCDLNKEAEEKIKNNDGIITPGEEMVINE